MESSNHFLVNESIGRLMVKYAVPSVISLLVGALYNIVDQIYIGHGVGYLGNGATSVVFPLTVVALAIAVMIGDGACSYISISLGKNDHNSARRTVGNAIVLSIVCSLVLMAFYLAFEVQILNVFGATEANFNYAKEYFDFIIIGIPVYMFGQAMNPIIRSDGSPRFAMLCTLAGAILNVILDPIAIFGLHWGMMGAAVATVAGQVVTAIMSIVYLTRMKSIKLNKESYKLRGSLIVSFIPLGFCSFLSQISMVISMAFTNNMLVQYGAMSIYGSDIPLTVLGIVMKVFQIIISIVIGMAAGCIPIVGFNFGANRFDRVKEVMHKLLFAEAVLGLIALILVEFFPSQITAIFGSADELYNQFAVITFRTYLSMIIFACVNKATFIFMQSMGKPVLSTLLSLFREVILSVPLVVFLPRICGGLDGVLYSMPLSDIIAFIASAIIIFMTERELNKKIKAQKSSADEQNVNTNPANAY